MHLEKTSQYIHISYIWNWRRRGPPAEGASEGLNAGYNISLLNDKKLDACKLDDMHALKEREREKGRNVCKSFQGKSMQILFIQNPVLLKIEDFNISKGVLKLTLPIGKFMRLPVFGNH